MILIIKVERKGKRIQLTFSDSTTLKINTEIYKKYNLASGDQLDEFFREQIRNENDFLEAKVSALRFLSLRNHSINELRQKLFKKKFSSEIIESVLHELSNLNYLNDRKFAEQFYHELINKFFGPLKVKNEMIKRGIDRKIIDEIILNYFNNDDFQKEIILRYLQKNKFTQRLKSKSELKKIYNHLSARGFTSEAILKGLKEKSINLKENEVN